MHVVLMQASQIALESMRHHLCVLDLAEVCCCHACWHVGNWLGLFRCSRADCANLLRTTLIRSPCSRWNGARMVLRCAWCHVCRDACVPYEGVKRRHTAFHWSCEWLFHRGQHNIAGLLERANVHAVSQRSLLEHHSYIAHAAFVPFLTLQWDAQCRSFGVKDSPATAHEPMLPAKQAQR